MPSFGYRDSPRRRHDLPPLVVLLLRPFFRYSAWRDAWILRIVGERFGPVIQATPGHEPAAAPAQVHEPPAARSPRRGTPSLRWPAVTPAVAALLVALGIAVAAVLGFVIARSTTGGSSPTALAKPTSAGLLRVSLPAGWQPRPTRQPRGLQPIDGIVAWSGDGFIEVGTATTTDPTLLSPAILALAPARLTVQLVTLDGTTFYRYSPLHLRGVDGQVSIYATPTQSGTVIAVCHPPIPPSSNAGFASTCQRVVQSIRLRSGPISPGLVPAYASTLTSAIGKLNAARTTSASQLSTARTDRLQASAANLVAAADTQAAGTLAGVVPGPARYGNAALVAALRNDADAYSALARAAAHRRVRAYRLAAAAVVQANDALAMALAGLGSFGYRVS